MNIVICRHVGSDITWSSAYRGPKCVHRAAAPRSFSGDNRSFSGRQPQPQRPTAVFGDMAGLEAHNAKAANFAAEQLTRDLIEEFPSQDEEDEEKLA